MVKVPNYKSYAVFQEQLKQKVVRSTKEAKVKLEEAKEYLEPKVKEGIKKAADLTEKTVNEAKEAYNNAKQMAQPKVEEFISDFQYALNPPKIEVLAKKVMSLEKKYLYESAFLHDIERFKPNETLLIAKHHKELLMLEQETLKAREEYNKFAARQAAMQKAFDRINSVKE